MMGREIYETLFTGIERPLDVSKWWLVLLHSTLSLVPGPLPDFALQL